MKRSKRTAGWMAATTAMLVAGLSGCGGGPDHERAVDDREPVAVDVVAVGQTEWTRGLDVTASVLPLVRATPGTVLMGRVDAVLVDEGEPVKRGQALARIESRDVTARLAQARAGVTAARAVEQNARRMHERMERLHARSAASDRDLEDAEAAYEGARAQLAAADEAVKVAEVQLDYSVVTSPFDGVVVEKRVEVGDTAAPGMPLFVVDDLSRAKIEAQVPESAATSLAVGDAVVVEFQGERLTGELSELLPAADPRTRTITVRALLDNPGGRLRSGMFARLFVGRGGHSTQTIPATALVRRGPLTGVFVVQDGADGRAVARLRWITIGVERDERVEVLTGLEDGERVVVAPDRTLSDGRPVEVRG